MLQLPNWLVWVPVVIWLGYKGSTGLAIFLAVWGTFVVSTVDNFIRPYLISQGAKLPLLLIFVGVIGGLLAYGFIGLFVGATLLGVGYTIFRSWLDEEPPPPQAIVLTGWLGRPRLAWYERPPWRKRDDDRLVALALALLAGYGLGSIPFGLLLTRWAGAGDIRAIGSGNIGATNVLRTGRKGLALATLLLDLAKGALPTALGLAWLGPWGAAAGRGRGHPRPLLPGLAGLQGRQGRGYRGRRGAGPDADRVPNDPRGLHRRRRRDPLGVAGLDRRRLPRPAGGPAA